jgi:hypothetical protein
MAMSALVARVRSDAVEYLAAVSAKGGDAWVKSPAEAVVFISSREATRQALRLPSALKAFAMPAPLNA